MRVVIDHRGVVTENDGRSGATTLVLPTTSAPQGIAPAALSAVTPVSASSYTLTTPGFYYFTARPAATASLPNPTTVPGSLWIINANAGTDALQLSSSNTAGTNAFYGLISGTTTQLYTAGNFLKIPAFGSVSLVSAGRSYLVLSYSGSVTIANT